MECLHSISLVVLKGLRSLNSLLSFLGLVFSFLYVNLNSFLLLKRFFTFFFTVNSLAIQGHTGVLGLSTLGSDSAYQAQRGRYKNVLGS